MVTLLPKTLNDISEHAKIEFPDECCGVILHDDTQEFVRPCRNIQNELHRDNPKAHPRDARTAYMMHPDDLIAVHKEAETQQRPIKAFYHSHPNHEAYFSEKDKTDAMAWGEPMYPDAAYIVISIYEDTIRSVKTFKWNEGAADFIEIPCQPTVSGANQMTALKVRLTFPTEKITEPIIYNIGQNYDVITNIRRANVTEEAGWVMLEIIGVSDEIALAIDYLKTNNVKVELVEGDVVH